MKKRFGNLSIKRKLLLIIMLTSGISVLLAFFAYTANNIILFKNRQVMRMKTMAHIIADNSQAALSFNDPSAAEEILSSLKSERRIVAAAVYSRNGTVFAAYKKENFPVLSKAELAAEQAYYKDSHLYVYQPILLDNESIGLVYFKVDMVEMNEAIIRYILFGAIIFVGCMIAAYFVALALQRSISSPISDLSRVTTAVSKDQNYSLRAVKRNNDELGDLVNRFNEMLQEIERRETAILAYNEALIRSNRELEQFTYVVSHDLQEPLRTVTVYSQMLAEETKETLDNERRKFIESIIQGSQRSQQLVRDLLEYSQVRSGEPVYGDMESSGALHEAMANLKLLIDENHVKIIEGRLPRLRGDKVRITHLFQNLLSNAIKFRKPDVPCEIRIDCEDRDHEWVFSVKDNGIGIEKKFLDRIFVIFQRLHTRDQYPGTGIGLAICRKIVEKHGGKIWVESELGKGATFYFSIEKKIAPFIL